MKFILLIFLMALVGACANRNVSISGERGHTILDTDRYGSEGAEIEVIAEGRGFLPRQLVRVSLIKEEYVNDLLMLHLGFKSRSNKFRTMQYRVTFFDENGMPLEDFSVGWFPVSVNPRTVTYQRVLAKTRDAKTYKVHVRKLIDPI